VDTSGTLLARAEAGEDGCPVLSGEMSAYCVAVTGRALGTLQIAQPARPFPLLPVAAREAADVCALELIQDSIRRETEEQIGAGLVEAILDGSLDTVALTARLARLGYDATPGRRHAAVALTGTGGVGEAVVRAVESDLRFAGRQGDASVLVLSHEEARLYLVSVAGVTGDARLREWLTTGLATAVQRGCTAGISRCVAGVGDLRLAVQQALATTVMSNRIHGHAGPLFYGDLGLHRLLLGLRDQLEVRRFYEETLSSLVAYDQRHNTELVRTLKAYFEQNGNISETARVLYVHRNTLNYRLQRIAEISGLDLESADTRLALQVALCVHTLSA
jgi:purine catabolism regulator